MSSMFPSFARPRFPDYGEAGPALRVIRYIMTCSCASEMCMDDIVSVVDNDGRVWQYIGNKHHKGDMEFV